MPSRARGAPSKPLQDWAAAACTGPNQRRLFVPCWRDPVSKENGRATPQTNSHKFGIRGPTQTDLDIKISRPIKDALTRNVLSATMDGFNASTASIEREITRQRFDPCRSKRKPRARSAGIRRIYPTCVRCASPSPGQHIRATAYRTSAQVQPPPAS
jgi:hypothetical protein